MIVRGRLYGVTTAADMLNMTAAQLNQAIHNGKLFAYLWGGRFMIPYDHIQNYKEVHHQYEQRRTGNILHL